MLRCTSLCIRAIPRASPRCCAPWRSAGSSNPGLPERASAFVGHGQGNSPSFFEHTILGCPRSGTPSVPLSQRALAMTEQPTIIIVDDDPRIREALSSLIRSVGVQAKALASVPEFLNEGRPTCRVLDVRLPGRSGLDFQRELAAASIHVPIIFITGYGDIPMSAQAIKGGAIEFLTKPFRDQDLLDEIQLGLARDRGAGERKGNRRACGRALRDAHPA
jgi:CheY-like chemotaxis protein